jgi:microcystin-dependent protein
MPADTRTLSLGALQMATGNDNNNWGDNFNSDILAVLERAHCGVASRAVTGGTLDLSGNPPPTAVSQVLDYVQIFTGTLTSDLTVVVPNKPKSWTFVNRTGGAPIMLVKTPNGAAISIPQGTEKLVVCDGGDNLLRSDRNDVGTIVDFAGAAQPPGFIECDGTELVRARFPDLFAKIGTTWGAGNGSTTFNLPNLKDTGRFRRSRSAAVTVGTYQANQFTAHNHSASLGGSTDAQGAHNHGGGTGGVGPHSHAGSVSTTDGSHNHSGVTVAGGAHGHSASSDVQGSHSHGGATAAESGSHTHQYNAPSGNTTVQAGTGVTVSNLSGLATTTTESVGHLHAIAADGNHNHNITVNAAADHSHGIATDGGHSHGLSIAADGAHAHTISSEPAHSHSVAVSGLTGTTGGSGETRPEAAVVIACIRY